MRNLQKAGGVCAVIAAATYVFAMGLVVSRLQPLADLGLGFQQSMDFLIANRTLAFIWHFAMYFVSGTCLVVVVLAIQERLEKVSPGLARIASAFGFIWVAFVFLSGLIVNYGGEALITLYGKNEGQAESLKTALDTAFLRRIRFVAVVERQGQLRLSDVGRPRKPSQATRKRRQQRGHAGCGAFAEDDHREAGIGGSPSRRRRVPHQRRVALEQRVKAPLGRRQGHGQNPAAPGGRQAELRPRATEEERRAFAWHPSDPAQRLEVPPHGGGSKPVEHGHGSPPGGRRYHAGPAGRARY